MGFELKRLQHFKFDKGQIVFIHIGKNAGTQIMYIANKLTKYGVHIKKYGHNIKLSNLPLNTKYFFSIRKPETRFASVFILEKEKGSHDFITSGIYMKVLLLMLLSMPMIWQKIYSLKILRVASRDKLLSP